VSDDKHVEGLGNKEILVFVDKEVYYNFLINGTILTEVQEHDHVHILLSGKRKTIYCNITYI